MSHAERLCDQVVLLARGRKVFDGTVQQARSRAPGRLILEGELTPEVIAALPGVAEVAAFLLSRASAHVTGQSWAVDGGVLGTLAIR
jgi:ABC-2 type transport system ATP-binding protein